MVLIFDHINLLIALATIYNLYRPKILTKVNAKNKNKNLQ